MYVLGRRSAPGDLITVAAKPVSYTPGNTDVMLGFSSEEVMRASSWGLFANSLGKGATNTAGFVWPMSREEGTRRGESLVARDGRFASCWLGCWRNTALL